MRQKLDELPREVKKIVDLVSRQGRHSGFKVQSSRFKVQGSKFKVQGSRFRVQNLGEIRVRSYK